MDDLSGPGVLRRREEVMGTIATVELHEPVPPGRTAAELADEVFDWLHEVDRRFSTYRDDSEVNRLNRRELRLEEASPDLRLVVAECSRLWSATDGFFDPYVTGSFDPSGYVKGWSVQVASERLSAAGVPNHLVDAGGDIQARGRPTGEEHWRIGVRHPWERDKVCWVLAGTDIAVATSGIYERGRHVIDPLTGGLPDELTSVTVVGRDLADADAYATAAVAMGRAGLSWLTGLRGYQVAVICADRSCYVSDDLPVAQTSLQPTLLSRS